ncbi:MAG: DMT family transporter [Thermoanaerobacterales bacterium]|nr:DMT family transporter [Thermoanaerobacterales bacterium]
MSAYLLALVIACLAGVTMAFQGAINSGAAKIIGLLEATFVVHVVGLVAVAVLLFAFRLGEGSLVRLPDASWYPYAGGILGVIILYGVMRSIPKVGVAPATTAIIIGQVFTAALIDHLGWFGLSKIPFNWCRVLGTLLMAGGAFLLLKK